ncbi:hypothetical protein Pyn_03445 [Prunus yedoensis var. nudiflora]|uniref:Uncharacterized protein n=1 Tax=Prunus yedoensis var. nudiflora TaxID=2094558 RepID=A0A314YQ20_PRUYE|nr:hypothetical protein Pyn_03445 [Prunus yedoensis var. nudiflora]
MAAISCSASDSNPFWVQLPMPPQPPNTSAAALMPFRTSLLTQPMLLTTPTFSSQPTLFSRCSSALPCSVPALFVPRTP